MLLWLTGRLGGGGGAGGLLPVGLDEQTLRWNNAVLAWVANSILANDGTDIFIQNMLKIGTVGTPPISSLHVESSNVTFFERTSTQSVIVRTAVFASHKSTVPIGDGFGVAIELNIEDNTSGLLSAGRIETRRAGADNTSNMLLSAILAAALSNNILLLSNGSILLGDLTIDGSTQVDLPFANGYVIKSGAFDATARSNALTADRDYNYPNYPGQIDIHNPRFSTGIFSDFGEDNAIKTGWDDVFGGAGAEFDATLSGIDSNHDGVFEGKTGTTATGFVVAAYGDDQTGFRLGGGVRYFECLIQVDDLSTAAQEFIMRFGFGDEVDGTEHEDGVWFEYDRLTNVNWLIKTGNAATRTSTDSGVAVIIDTYIRLRAEVNAAGSSVEYFINGASVGTIITNIPTTDINQSMSITKSAGTTSRRFLVDYYDQRVIYTTPR